MRLGLVHALLLGGCVPVRPESALFGDVERKFRIRVQWEIDESFFSGDWRDPQIDPTATRISERELQRFPGILDRALSRYPAGVIARDLRRVCLARKLRFYGVGFGGTNSTDSIYVCSEGVVAGYTDEYLEGTVHHELSSILMRNHAFPREAFAAHNAPGFAYSDAEQGGVGAIRENRHDLEGSPELYDLGLLAGYSRSELEEDANLFFETMMTDPNRVQRLAERYPRIRGKLEVCREFYRGLGIELHGRR